MSIPSEAASAISSDDGDGGYSTMDISMFWLGMGENQPTHWGGPKRRCIVIDRPLLATGRPAWRVQVKPSLPRPGGGDPLREVVVAERYPGRRLDELDGDYVTVNVASIAVGASDRDQFREGDLAIEYVAEAAPRPDLLPDGRDVQRFWDESLARITRFIDQHGHSLVPDGYHDEQGRLEILVHNIRFHHGGKTGMSEGPFPGVDYVADLERLDGWEWDPDGRIAAWEPPASDAYDPRTQP